MRKAKQRSTDGSSTNDSQEQQADAVAERAREQLTGASLSGAELCRRVAPLIGTDLSDVVVHDSPSDRAMADTLNARAFTVKNDIWLGSGESSSDVHLMAHELAHVVQQRVRGASSIQCKKKDKPPSSQPSSYQLLSTQELQALYDRLVGAELTEPAPAGEKVESQPGGESFEPPPAGELNEIARILALRHGVFSTEEINTVKALFIENAHLPKGTRKQCITVLNAALRQLLNLKGRRLGSSLVETMAVTRSLDLASPPLEFEFLDARGRLDKSGSEEPIRLASSVWAGILNLASGQRGWIVFGLSILGDYHTVTLSLDNTDPSSPTLYWSDQFMGREPANVRGWARVSSGEVLDQTIEKLTRKWWKDNESRHFSPHARLWRINPASPRPT